MTRRRPVEGDSTPSSDTGRRRNLRTNRESSTEEPKRATRSGGTRQGAGQRTKQRTRQVQRSQPNAATEEWTSAEPVQKVSVPKSKPVSRNNSTFSRIKNGTLTYSVEPDTSFMLVIMNAIEGGIDPIVIHDSVIERAHVDMSQLTTNVETMPTDYVPVEGKERKASNVEVDII
jgi:hypothetical protein